MSNRCKWQGGMNTNLFRLSPKSEINFTEAHIFQLVGVDIHYGNMDKNAVISLLKEAKKNTIFFIDYISMFDPSECKDILFSCFNQVFFRNDQNRTLWNFIVDNAFIINLNDSTPTDQNLQDLVLNAFLQADNFSKFKAASKVLSKALDALIKDLESSLLTFVPISERCRQALNHYVDVANYVKNEGKITNAINYLKELNEYNHRQNFSFSPFMFICAPSGTGKTNMSFAIECPYLYFLFVDTAQSIYECFKSQSDVFRNLIDKDLQTYAEDGLIYFFISSCRISLCHYSE